MVVVHFYKENVAGREICEGTQCPVLAHFAVHCSKDRALLSKTVTFGQLCDLPLVERDSERGNWAFRRCCCWELACC